MLENVVIPDNDNISVTYLAVAWDIVNIHILCLTW